MLLQDIPIVMLLVESNKAFTDLYLFSQLVSK